MEVTVSKLTIDMPLIEDDLRQIEHEGKQADEVGDCPYLEEGPAREAWLKGFRSPRDHEFHPHEVFHRGI
jgi:hypothetical protein